MNNDEFLKRLRAAFAQEAEEHVRTVASGLLDLEKGGAADPALLESVYRAAHSLKGAARAVGLKDVEEICQAMESVLRTWRQGGIGFSRPLIDCLLEGLDGVRRLVSGQDAPDGEQVRQLVATLEAAAAGRVGAPATAATAGPTAPLPRRQAPEETPGRGTPLESPERKAAMSDEPLPGSAPAHKAPIRPASAAPVPAEPLPAQPGPARTGTEPTAKAASVQASLMPLQPSAPQAAPLATESGASQVTVRVAADRLDDLLRQMEGTLAARLAAEHLQQDLRFLRSEVAEFHKQWSAAMKDTEHSQEPTGATQGRSARFEGFRERLRNIDRHVATLTRKAQGHSKSLGRMVDSLLRDGKRVAMQPFSALTGAFPLMVREIARKEGKEVRFEVSGDSVEMDKRLLDELKSPMTHLLRNSIDHGIERPEVRVQQKKPSHGTIRVEVIQVDSGKVRVDISDDGAGIQHQKVASAAVARGLVSAEQAQLLSSEGALALIFHSGLSTAPIVTDLSGHGLGLAIVRQKVEELGGQVKVRSAEGNGTVFSLLLPMTLATFRGLVVEVEGRVFVLPTALVARVIRVAQDKVSTVEGQETVRVEGRVVPLVRLEDALELPRRSLPGIRQNYLQAVVTRSGEDQVAFAVDRIGAEQEVLVKGLGPQLARVRNVAGATVLGSGEVVPILNVSDLILTARSRYLGRRKEAAPATAARKQRVLVAEDSITSRLLLKSILESAGYDVTTAVDGAEALSLLKAEEFDILVSDVEMPRMDGLQLTEKVRAEARLEQLPVILVTALESRTDRERGIDAGANAYIVKSSFDQGNLLDTVRRFL